MSKETMARIEKVLKKTPEARHSYFQLKYFVLGKEPTIQGQMWKALRELEERKEAIDAHIMEIDELKDQLELIDIENEKEFALFSSDRETAIKKRQHERKKVLLEKTLEKKQKHLQFVWQEARFFLEAFENLEQIAPLKDYDDLDAQKEYWDAKLEQYIELKLQLGQPLDTESVITALALHNDASIKFKVSNYLKKDKDAITTSKNNQSG